MNDINTHIHKLINVYQENYKNGKCSGLGDFIRGSYFLMQFCDKFHIEYEISFYNHLLGNYLKNVDKNKYTGISDVSIIATRELLYRTQQENIL